MFTVFLKDANQESLLEVGSKALHLANVINEGVNIPNGFVLKANALKTFMNEHSLHAQVHKEEFIDVFMEAPLPKDLEKEVLASYEKLKELTGSVDLSVAVRSSSSAEDLEDASFAGQYETILNVCDEEQLLYAVKQCWASLFSDRVREYAAQKDISLDAFPMGILIQQMVFPDVSGVIFSLNPITQDPNEIIINASYGLGESIVSGIVTPDTFIVNKETKSIMKDLGLKEVKILPLNNQIIEVETTPEESDSFCLNEDGILALESVTSNLEEFYEFPVDIEFAIKDDTIFVLQSRPITS
ncbi:PEP/pyruvate-binding domain-containing protein [Peribacillus sp. NPDC097675]|uniref:PEP/pyruvate-binding domain-containing protein n=1 Tax=Peribacillus sp. NPDC097675 TaxID=3390618 RepID=UPI003D01E5D7